MLCYLWNNSYDRDFELDHLHVRHMYSVYKRILSSSNIIINAITDSFTFISTLCEEWLKELF